MALGTAHTRDCIVSAAAKLFYAEGIRAVSVDAVSENAGITKKTFYYHFRSKDGLIAAYLESRDQPATFLRSRRVCRYASLAAMARATSRAGS